jgi:hypothetical protein
MGVATSLRATAAAAATGQTVIIDSRLPEARAFLKSVRAAKIIDLARTDKSLWHLVRDDVSTPGRVSGLTGWSDWVVLRGLFEEQGKRVRRDERITHIGARMSTPFQWEMG